MIQPLSKDVFGIFSPFARQPISWDYPISAVRPPRCPATLIWWTAFSYIIVASSINPYHVIIILLFHSTERIIYGIPYFIHLGPCWSRMWYPSTGTVSLASKAAIPAGHFSIFGLSRLSRSSSAYHISVSELIPRPPDISRWNSLGGKSVSCWNTFLKSLVHRRCLQFTTLCFLSKRPSKVRIPCTVIMRSENLPIKPESFPNSIREAREDVWIEAKNSIGSYCVKHSQNDF